MPRWSSLSVTAQGWCIAVAEFLLGLLLLSAGLYELAPVRVEAPAAVRVGLLAAVCGAAVLRARRPVAALVLGAVPLGIDLLLGPSLPVWLVYSDLLYAGVRYGTERQARALLGLASALSAASFGVVYVVTGNWQLLVLTTIALSAFVGTPLWWGRAVRLHKDVADAERARAEAVTTIAELDRRAAVAAERNRMARDLHDVVAGHLSAIAIQSEAALGLSRDASSPTARRMEALHAVLESVRSNSVDALEEMREMIGLLRDRPVLGETTAPGRLAHLGKLVDSAHAGGTVVHVRRSGPGRQLPVAVDHAAYRIVQEALTNAAKHAPGVPVELSLDARGDRLEVTVRNPLPDGTVAAPRTPSGGRGLASMRERTELLGGRFRAGPSDGTWVVGASLPLRPGAPS
ncbi:histidine kinase [Rhodococcus aetherivorans]|uniref:sensor histidine kinase n=1 Tax=Rhodococcus aetherivorans TaxID=191292 RepID=UPI0031DD382B